MKLEDASMFPFGKYGPKPKGNESMMQDVPASYLLWLGDQPWIGTWPDVAKYIESNRVTLEKEVDGR